jgi:hypothetical protein
MNLPQRMILILLGLALTLGARAALSSPGAPFAFAIVGDAPYNGLEEAAFAQMLKQIDAEGLAFVVHVGDFKSGASRCSDALYAQRKQMFEVSRHPFILVPGDNDWTDCHRGSAGSYDPIERLAKLRQVFYPDAFSLGRNRIELERQSDAPGTPSAFREYRENVRWIYGGVLFLGLNIPGSNDNFGRTPQMDAEHALRGRANAAWLEQGFALARANEYAAVFVVIQADPEFERLSLRLGADGYAAFKRLLLEHTLALAKPVILVHGDGHSVHFDHPLIDPTTGARVDRFTRIESFGSPIVEWIRVNVEPGKPQPVSVRIGKPLPEISD